MRRTLAIDIETYSSVDLKSCGVYRYATSPDFTVLLFAYAYDNEPVQVVDLATGGRIPQDVMEDLEDADVVKTAFNAAFEITCLNSFFKGIYPITLSPDQWECTMVRSAIAGLPLSLEAAAKALKLEEQKMDAGKALIRFFSLPCKPTRTNGQRTRNFPHHDLDRWELFKDYCAQDVNTERAIRNALRYVDRTVEFEHNLWVLDQKINDRGILVDLQLVENAIEIDANHKEVLTREAAALTGLDNPNSVAQMKGWLEDRTEGDIDSLNKESIKTLLQETDCPDVTRALELRQELSKTSVKKYEAMRNGAGDDSRVRGLLQFYGANRTGRWAGRLVQVQNLPQNHLQDLDLARCLVLDNDTEMLQMCYNNIPSVLSELIRTAFVAPSGHTFLVADFSAIEARVIAWLAGERWRLDVFKTHGKIYEASAAQMFKVPIESIGKGSPLRQKGKVAELACIAEGQQVLTDKGLVPIELVTKEMRLWDGIEWVNHDGVILQGTRKVISYDGLTATQDHLVWVEGEQNPIQLGVAATSGARLVQSGDGRNPIRLGGDYISRKEVEEELEGTESINPVRELQSDSMDIPVKPYPRTKQGVSELLAASRDSALVGPKIDRSQAAMREPKRQRLQELRSERDRVSVQICNTSGAIPNEDVPRSGQSYGDGQDQQQWSLRAGEHENGFKSGKSSKQTPYSFTRMDSRAMALRKVGSDSQTVERIDTGADNIGSQVSSGRQAEELEINSAEVRVYDILNAGKRHRFTVEGKLVHNCGYGGGVGALKAMGALKMGIEEGELQGLINGWRKANPAIVKLWRNTEEAALEAVHERSTFEVQNGVVFKGTDTALQAHLPSGRTLYYHNPRLTLNRFGGHSLQYEGMDQTTKTWGRVDTHGGKLVENLVQAISRDCLADCMTRLDWAGYKIVMHVHDEVVIEAPQEGAEEALHKVCEIMGKELDWAKGLPLRADGYVTPYYKKD